VFSTKFSAFTDNNTGLKYTLTPFKTCVLIIHHENTINIHTCTDSTLAERLLLIRVESEGGSTVSGNEANDKAKNKEEIS
jgi:hypothetical protein